MSELRVVIADDAMFMRTVLKNLLLEENIEVVGEASNGNEAIELAKAERPDIMTLDITMPELDGISAIPKILEASPNTKIIMVSAMGQQGMVIDAIKKGAKDFITKPFEKSRILQAIKKVMDY
ncbi:MAG: two-component system response regulator [Clostridiales bacterium GWE2_32_10]|nr:MAG: two-component system response regulator [Clostridiales bacterium GWE2_32_10]HBY20410.1 two-component system response regulator [Clostridiales bacterium]